MEVDRVSCEPFSDVYSLLTGKNTGKFTNFDLKTERTEQSMLLKISELLRK